jgi:hypothetical protein
VAHREGLALQRNQWKATTVTPERWNQVKVLFQQAVELDETGREAFLGRACDNESLRREVELLISGHKRAGSFIESPPSDLAAKVMADQKTTTMLAEGYVDQYPRTESLNGQRFLSRPLAGGRYQIQRLLGEGGQKVVYLARDDRLNREVVIALLRTDGLDVEGVARLWREARAMGQLGDHPNIVTVYDIGEEEGQPYIVSGFVQGGSVADLLHNANRQPLALEQVLRLGVQICRALGHTHSRGIIHRDLKPGNVWLTQDGTAKLGDFGLAVGLDLSRITMEGMLIGTVAYMPPELAIGQPAEPRSDLYSLGAMLYEMLTGRTPFMGDQLVGIIWQHINTPPVAPSWHNPEIPPLLETLILRLLAKAPQDRPASAAEVETALAAIASSAPALADRVVQPDAKSLARLAGGVFVGREQETKALRAGLDDAMSGRGRLLMVSGEPGSGKTRTAEQLMTYAGLRDAEVLIGRCYEGEGAPAFWPWVQIIRAYVKDRGPEVLTRIMGPGAADIAQVVPEVRDRLPELPAPPALEPEQARFRLFDSISAFLKNASRERPTVLILDDLHWADKPSLLLLQFLARELRDIRVLVVGTYRNIELGRQHPLAQTLGELTRQGMGERIFLRGLTRRNVAQFIEMTTGTRPSDRVVSSVHKDTDGNPFFLTEVVRLLASEGILARIEEEDTWSVRIPEGVREVIGRRLDHLSKECNHVLSIASVIGREFSVAVLEPVSELSSDHLLEILEEAVTARVIAEDLRAVGCYGFYHALIRETLYDELTVARRVRLHRRIGGILETLYAGALEPYLAELAYHFFQAADTHKAILYAIKAAERATTLLAYEEAVDHYKRALQALELEEETEDGSQCEIVLALGQAQTRAGNAARAKEAFQQAADMARRLGRPEQLAKAALGMGVGAVIGLRYGTLDESQIRLLKEALNALGDDDSTLRIGVLAQLSLALYYSVEERALLSRQAVEMARRTGDEAALLAALYSLSISLEGFEAAKERLAAATEIITVAERLGNKEMALRGHFRRIRDLYTVGDISAIGQETETYSRLADELRQPLYLWLAPFYQSTVAMLDGRFDECERLAHQALAIGERAQDQNAIVFFNVQIVTLRGLQGRSSEVEPNVKGMVEKSPAGAKGWQATLAKLYYDMDRRAEARAEFDRLALNDFTDLPIDGAYVTGLALLAQVAAYLGDATRAAILYELLKPFARQNIAIGSAAVFYGPASRYLGLLAATMSRWEEAGAHFENAIQATAAMGAKPFGAYVQVEYAAMLLASGLDGATDKASELLDRGLATARELGMNKLIQDAMAAGKRGQQDSQRREEF